MELVLKLIATGGIIGILDFLWLGVIAKKLYYGEMGKILLEKPNMLPALLFYAIFVIGLVVFVVSSALEKDSWLHALMYGALFGFVTYATYDLTNLSTMKGFSAKVASIDMLWGTLMAAAGAVGAFWIVKYLA